MADSQIGRTLGSYRLVERIGVGGMGVVFRAVHLKLGREAAVKILPETLAADQDFLRRFEREAANAAALRHNNILAVWEYGEERGVPYLVMPYIGGGTLRHELAAGPLSPQEALRYLRQIADALDYAHSEGIIHRDVKPANLLLDERKQVILGDFGIAKALEGAEGLTRTGMGVGTPEYMAPEQAQGRADARSDLYALGIVLYQMLTGHVPFSGNSTVEVLMKHLQDPLPIVPLRSVQPALPPGVEQIIQTALAKNPNDRYQNAKALVDALDAALTGGPAQAYGQTAGSNQLTAYAHTMPYGTPSPTTPPAHGGAGGYGQAGHWSTPTPATPASLPSLPLQQTQTPYPIPQPYHTPMPQQIPAPPQPLAGGYAAAPAAAGGGNRLLIGALGGVAVLLLLCLTSIGAYALFRPDATPTPRPTVNAATTSTAAAAVAASLSATQTASAPTPTVAPTATIPPLPTPTVAAAPSTAPTPTAPRPPTATSVPTAVASTAPIGSAPAGWKTYNGHANAPFSIYYPPDWTIDEQSAKDGVIYIRPPSGASTWMLIATTGKAETNGNIDVLRDQYYNNTLGECTQKAIDRTNYTEYAGLTFAGLGATCETTSGLTYARIGIGLKGQVPWRYRLNSPYGEYADTLDKYFVKMLNSLNVYQNP